ncbi:uncharacterized protein BCR38DRAFT_479150 [Pseudomassariella vexata]|uniref:RRM domain-containing protein n=1 Tax=Pseudomassariella vexata TaxID=1141098 RepID=A0A1Y2D9B8_9PEZI|nr:uncharacterized protein BCR38DRAFT_479150 [Pseudomassariella vexata]ORY55245.1 hypothetical protein BCR38DRAFT_479150 [Pseudomassariella vexata]
MSDSSNWRVSSDWRKPSQTGPWPQNNYPQKSVRTQKVEDGPISSNLRQRQPNRRWAERSRPEDVRVHWPTPQRDDDAAANAIAEGRRIYLGNLFYRATPDDIEDLLKINEVNAFKSIHISIDPISGRNPGYCFIEFADREAAETAIVTLDGKPLFDRGVKSRPCLPKGESRTRAGRDQDSSGSSGFKRWGDWTGRNDEGDSASLPSQNSDRNGPQDALQYFVSSSSQGRQLYVGGLPRMLDQAMNEEEIRSIFEGYEVTTVGKRISPNEATRRRPGRHNFCFVDFSTSEQAKAALDAVNGAEYRGAPLKVFTARGKRNDWP